MGEITLEPFAGLTAITEIIIQNAQTEVLANIDLIIALLGHSGNDYQAAVPHFNNIEPAMADSLVVELENLKTVIDAAPVV